MKPLDSKTKRAKNEEKVERMLSNNSLLYMFRTAIPFGYLKLSHGQTAYHVTEHGQYAESDNLFYDFLFRLDLFKDP